MATTHAQRRNTLLNQLARLAPELRTAQKQAETSISPVAKERKSASEAKFDKLLRDLEANRLMVQGENPGQAGMFD